MNERVRAHNQDHFLLLLLLYEINHQDVINVSNSAILCYLFRICVHHQTTETAQKENR